MNRELLSKLMDWRGWVAWLKKLPLPKLSWRVWRWALLVPVVLIVALILLPFLIPVSVYKDKIIEQVRLATGRELKIDGDLRLSFWPAFGVRVEKVAFANAPGAAEPQMATMDTMIVGAELFPLLAGSLRVSEVRFVKPVIHLEVDANGRGNWIFEGASAPAAAPSDGKGLEGDISFADVRVDDGVLTYRDARSGTVQRVEGVDASVRLPSLDEPMTVDGALTWNKEEVEIEAKIGELRALSSGAKSALVLKVDGEVMEAAFDGTFDASGKAASGKVEFAADSLKRLATWVGANAGNADQLGAIKISGAVTAQAAAIDFTDTKVSVGGGELEATITGKLDVEQTKFAGDVDARAESLRALAKRAGVSLPGSSGLGATTLRGPLSLAGGRVLLNKTSFSVDGEGLKGTFSGAFDTARGTLAGLIDVRTDSARELARRVDVALPAGRGFGPATLAGAISTAPGRVSFKDAKFSVDGDLLRATFTGLLEPAAAKVAGVADLRSRSARELAGIAGFQLPGTRGFGPLTVTGPINISAGRVALNGTQLSVDGDILRTSFTGVVETSTGKIAGTVDLRSSSARELAGRAGFQLPGTQGLGPLTVTGAVTATGDRIAFNDTKLSVDGDVLRASFTGMFESAGGKIAGKVDLRSSSARQLAGRAGFALPGDNGFGALAISGALNSAPSRLAFDDAKISLDGMNGSGDVTLTTSGGRTHAKAKLSLDRLDLNPYAGGGAGPKTAGSIAPWSESAIDVSALRAIDADLAFATDALHAGGLRIGRSVLDITLSGGKLRANLKQMALYDGNGTGSVTLSGAGAAPEVAVDLALSGVKAEPFFVDLAGVNRLSGVGNITFKVSGTGRSQSAIMRSLDGTAQIKLEDGAIKGANLAEVARTIQAVLSGAAVGSSAKTDFAELSASLVIANGVGRNDDLRLLNPFVRLSGAGTVDIANQRLDYRVEPRAVRSAEGQGGSKDLRGVGIPFKIQGPWSRLSYAPDLSGVVNTTIDSILKGGDPLEGLKNETGLDELFGKKKKPPVAPAEPAPGGEPQPPPSAEPPPPPKAAPQPQPETPPAAPPGEGEPATPPAQPGESVPPDTQQQGAQPRKTDPKQKVDPLDALKGLFGQ